MTQKSKLEAAMQNNELPEFDRRLGRKIREARQLRGLTQTELGKALGVSYQQVQKNEMGKSRVSAERLEALCKVLDMPLSYFLGTSEIPRSQWLFPAESVAASPSPRDGALVVSFSKIIHPASSSDTGLTDSRARSPSKNPYSPLVRLVLWPSSRITISGTVMVFGIILRICSPNEQACKFMSTLVSRTRGVRSLARELEQIIRFALLKFDLIEQYPQIQTPNVQQLC